MRADADEALERVGLRELADRPVAGLAYGQLKRIELARALCERPRLLMLDEPASGPQPRRGRRAGRPARRPRRPDAADRRAPHGHGHARLRPDRRARLRPGDRRRQAGARSSATSASSRPTWERPHEPLLEVEGLHAGYGPVNVLEDVSLTVGEGETVALLGANGAGKTTTLRAICGMVKPRGSVRIGGRDVSKQLDRADRPARRRARARGARDVRAADGRGEPAARRLLAPREGLASSAPSSSSRAWRSAATSRPGRSAAASSRCSRSRAR